MCALPSVALETPLSLLVQFDITTIKLEKQTSTEQTAEDFFTTMSNSSDVCEPLEPSAANGSGWSRIYNLTAADLWPVSLYAVLLKGSFLVLIIIVTIVGNLLVLLSVFLHPSLRTTTNCFIVNLAIADLLLGVSVLPFSASLELLEKKWFFGQAFCGVWAATDVLCCTASILSLCVISIDRYIGVTLPLTYSAIVTHKRAIIACVFVWIVSFAISVGPLLGWKEPPPEDPYTCEVTKQTGYVLFSVCFSFYVPTMVILFLYCRIYKAAAQQTKFLETGVKVVKTAAGNATRTTPTSHHQEELTLRVHLGAYHVMTKSRVHTEDGEKILPPKMILPGLQNRLAKFKRQKKAAKTLGIVVGVFIMCWFPFFFLLPLGTLCAGCLVPPALFDFCFWTGYFNSCLNPIIYACSISDFKMAFRCLLRCQCTPRRSTILQRREHRRFRTKTIRFPLRQEEKNSQAVQHGFVKPQ